MCFFRWLVLVGSSQGPLFFAAPLHHKPDAVLEEARGPWARLGQTDGWPLAWGLSPLLGLALGTSTLLSSPGRRRAGLPVQKSERFSSRCLASSPTWEASQRRDCPFVFKRGTVRFLKSLIYSWVLPHTPLPETLLPPHIPLQPLPSPALPSTTTQHPPPPPRNNSPVTTHEGPLLLLTHLQYCLKPQWQYHLVIILLNCKPRKETWNTAEQWGPGNTGGMALSKPQH